MGRRPPYPTLSYTLTPGTAILAGETDKETAVIRNRIKSTQDKTPGFQLVLLPFLPQGLCTCRPLSLKCPLSLLHLQNSAHVLWGKPLCAARQGLALPPLCSHCPGMYLSLGCCNELCLRGPGSVLFILDTTLGLQWSPSTFC